MLTKCSKNNSHVSLSTTIGWSSYSLETTDFTQHCISASELAVSGIYLFISPISFTLFSCYITQLILFTTFVVHRIGPIYYPFSFSLQAQNQAFPQILPTINWWHAYVSYISVSSVFSQTWLCYVWLMTWQIRLSVCRLWCACTLLRGFNFSGIFLHRIVAWPSGNSIKNTKIVQGDHPQRGR